MSLYEMGFILFGSWCATVLVGLAAHELFMEWVND